MVEAHTVGYLVKLLGVGLIFNRYWPKGILYSDRGPHSKSRSHSHKSHSRSLPESHSHSRHDSGSGSSTRSSHSSRSRRSSSSSSSRGRRRGSAEYAGDLLEDRRERKAVMGAGGRDGGYSTDFMQYHHGLAPVYEENSRGSWYY